MGRGRRRDEPGARAVSACTGHSEAWGQQDLPLPRHTVVRHHEARQLHVGATPSATRQAGSRKDFCP